MWRLLERRARIHIRSLFFERIGVLDDSEFSRTAQGRVGHRLFPPEAKAAATHLACRKPDDPIAIPELPPVKLTQDLLAANLLSIDGSGQWWLKVPVSRFSAAVIRWLLILFEIVSKISVRTVSRWLKAEKIKPWQFRTWITATDLEAFLPRARAVLDLYARVTRLTPLEIVWCLDEKTSIQARAHKIQEPAGPGRISRLENTYERRGASQLLAGLNVLTGNVLGIVRDQKRFAQFQELIYSVVDASLKLGKTIIHLILDNGSTHRPKYLEQWLANTFENLVFHVHWLPIHSSWLNQIEIYFSRLQTCALTPNNFASKSALVERILHFLAWTNIEPRPIKWTYTTHELYAKCGRDPTPTVW